MTFDEQTNVPGVYWSDMAPLTVRTSAGMSGGLLYSSDIALDANRTAVVAEPYPRGTVAGPGTVTFYSIAGGLFQWEGGPVSFTADPAACVDVDLPVHFVDLAAPDAGPDAAP
jgi:hypothetical protein